MSTTTTRHLDRLAKLEIGQASALGNAERLSRQVDSLTSELNDATAKSVGAYKAALDLTKERDALRELARDLMDGYCAHSQSCMYWRSCICGADSYWGRAKAIGVFDEREGR